MVVPEPQRELLEQILAKLKTDERLLGVAIAGSYLTGEMDEYSDLDLIIVVDDAHYQQVLQERQLLASKLAPIYHSLLLPASLSINNAINCLLSSRSRFSKVSPNSH
ncbi:MAG: hypothetical protein FWK04_03820 [Nostoc sp. GBBB01]|jgi:predicted nucleotidyltransferase|uniref:Nucleotidyltransferase domain-containing protein n=1 Tax=Nostoc punctiforme FACHB-252 TaxID=1357509 RepID=A0ABR8HBX2_NOSPU|nr:nucleotidyltransferase domain-containing protein [Nostoc punctiforme]MBD2612801.1 nucleotidyltransferase domain-containing protein [Nostoc punctiforme FACHB-252]MBL1198216.1 hypothetical protein [Nostoc sp. GBBB01]